VSNILFCPTQAAVDNLQKEGYPFVVANGQKQRVEKVGDVMQDSSQFFAQRATPPLDFNVPEGFILTTIHRAENTDDTARLTNIFNALNELAKATPVVLPIHPRTRKIVENLNIDTSQLILIAPVGYLEMIWLLQHAGLVLTDSGGVQKEAYFFNKACVTMRDQTEWVELVEVGANELVGADFNQIVAAARKNLGRKVKDENQLYGGGRAAKQLALELKNYLCQEV
jgi:UDP-GlcNAc3NAcA epimerase